MTHEQTNGLDKFTHHETCITPPMPILRINSGQLDEVERFLERSRHLYRNVGHEDLPAMLDHQIALLGKEGAQIWGFLCVQSERRPSTLPKDAPNRAYIRAVALAASRAHNEAVAQLLTAATPLLSDYAPAHELSVYGDQMWLNFALAAAGFDVAEEIQFMALSRVQRWQAAAHIRCAIGRAKASHPTVDLRPIHMTDLVPLAELDAQTFSPLWHFGVDGLRELIFTSRFQVLTVEGMCVGYSAISHHDRQAHLSRLAVHPAWQGQGLGHLLLHDLLLDAQAAGIHEIMLNTQVDNSRAQALYKSYGFQPTAQRVPIYIKHIPC